MDFKALASRLGLDEADFVELVALFVTTSLSDIDKMKQALGQNSQQDAAAAAHSIKGAAGNLGFNDLFELAKIMEMQARKGDMKKFSDHLADLESQVSELDRA